MLRALLDQDGLLEAASGVRSPADAARAARCQQLFRALAQRALPAASATAAAAPPEGTPAQSALRRLAAHEVALQVLLLALGSGGGGGGGGGTSTGTGTGVVGSGSGSGGGGGGGSSRGRTAGEALLPLVSAPLLPRAARVEQLKLVRAAFAFLCAFCHGCARNQEVASSLSPSPSPSLSLNPSLNPSLSQASRSLCTRTPHPSPLTPHPVTVPLIPRPHPRHHPHL